MKRERQANDTNYVIKEIVTTDRPTREPSHNQEYFSVDNKNAYVTVQVSKENDKMINKDAQSNYNVAQASSNYFVLSLKSDNKIRIAVPYYRTCEANVNGTPIVTVSNFYPAGTEQATPPLGLNVIGQTASLYKIIENGKMGNMIKTESMHSQSPLLHQPAVKPIQYMSPRLEKEVLRRPAPSTYILPKETSLRISDPNPKRLRQNLEYDLKQSYWNDKEFNCVHSKDIKKQDGVLDFQLSNEHLLIKSFLNYMIQKRELKVEDICTEFKGSEVAVIKIANILSALHVIKYIVVDSIKNEGMYVFPDLDENSVKPVVNDQTTFSEEEIKKKEQELDRLRKRTELLTSLTSSDSVTPGYIFNRLVRENPDLLNEPLYKQLSGLPIIRDSISHTSY